MKKFSVSEYFKEDKIHYNHYSWGFRKTFFPKTRIGMFRKSYFICG